MIIIYSPAKTMQFERTITTAYQPSEAYRPLLQELQSYSIKQLQNRFKVSKTLAESVYLMYQSFDEAHTNMALACYTGLAYQALTPFEYSKDQLEYAHQHLRILDAFYGILSPLMMVKPYRLDFATKLKKNLYNYWKLNLEQPILNLASNEYAAMIKQPYITVQFLQEEKGKFINKSTYAKQARGQMLHHLITHQVRSIDEVRAFQQDGYHFHQELSNNSTLVFTRKKSP